MKVHHIQISMRGGKHPSINVQYIHITMRGGKDLSVEVQREISLRGGMDPSMKVRHIHISMRGGKDLPMEVQHKISSRGRKDSSMKVHHIIYFKDGVTGKPKHLNNCSKLHRHSVCWKVTHDFNYSNIEYRTCSKSGVEAVFQAISICMLRERVFGICDTTFPCYIVVSYYA